MVPTYKQILLEFKGLVGKCKIVEEVIIEYHISSFQQKSSTFRPESAQNVFHTLL